MNVVEMEVTPAQAQDWLANMRTNRSVSKSLVRKYARAMLTNSWVSRTNETIAIDEEGYVIDGQHRLHAVVMAQQPVRMAVMFGCDNHVGVARTRSAEDVAKIIYDEKLPANTNAVVKAMFSTPELTPHEVVGAFRRHRDAITYAVRKLVNTEEKHINTGAVVAAIARAYYHVKPDTLDKFCAALRTGYMKFTCDATAISLRKLLQKNANGRMSALPSRTVMRYTEYAIYQYASNKQLTVRQLKALDKELYAIPEETTCHTTSPSP